VLANGLKQGDVASLLKSWNSLNRNEQAYLNNMDNLNSLPGLQVAYIRENMNAEAALTAFTDLNGNPDEPPDQTDLLAAKDALAAQAVLDAQARILAETPAPGDEELVEAYGGADLAQTVVDAFADTYSPADPQTIIDQFNAWTTYQGAAALAEDAFLAASVSYKGEVYDEAVFGALREHVDGIVEMKGLDTLIADFDAAAADATEPEPTDPEGTTDSGEPELILPE
jgi:hypothetical protein